MYLTSPQSQLWIYTDAGAVDWNATWEDSDANGMRSALVQPGNNTGSLEAAGSALFLGNGTAGQTNSPPLAPNCARRLVTFSAHARMANATAVLVRVRESLDGGTTLRTVFSASLQPSEHLLFNENRGWFTGPILLQSNPLVQIANRLLGELALLNEVLVASNNPNGIDLTSMRQDPQYRVF